jgi:cytochrome c1
MNLLSYRNLMQPGGPEFSEAQAKAMAASAQIPFINDEGQPAERPGELSDRFRSPYPNVQAASFANNGKPPPDLSLMAKARTYPRGFPWFLFDAVTGFNNDQGANYIYGLLTGYRDPPAGTTVQEGLHYNEYFPGHWIGMPNMLRDEAVSYSDGSPQTVAQYARDVTAFLMWAAEPQLEERKRIGFQVMVFLILFAGLVYYTKRKVWAAAH